MTLVWGGLALGAVYALVAIGYNIVYLASRTFNFANAQLIMVGTFLAYSGLVSWQLPTVVVALVSIAAVGLLALVEERIAIRPLKDEHGVLVTTLGAAILLNGLTQLIWGAQPLSVPFFAGDKVLTVIGGRVYPVELVLIALPILLVVIMVLLSRNTMAGLALLGTSEDREAATLRGIDVRRLSMYAFVASGALAGLLGLFVGPKTFAVATLGTSLALKGFVVLAIGGFGSLPGTLIGGLVVGLVEALATWKIGSQYAALSVFVVLLIVLMARPAGLFVRAVERAV